MTRPMLSLSSLRVFTKMILFSAWLVVTTLIAPDFAFAAPANDNFAGAQVISGAGGNLTGTTAGATKETGEPNHANYEGGNSVWYKWTAPASKRMVFGAYSEDYDVLLGIYTANGSPAQVGSLTSVGVSEYSNQIIFNAVANRVYYIAVDGYFASGSFNFVWETAPANDNFAAAQLLSGLSGSVTGHNIAASKETNEPNHDGYSGGASVWYKWTAPATANFTFDTIGSNFDTLLGIYKANASPPSLGALTRVTSDNNNGNDEGADKAAFDATAGTVYYVAVDGYDNLWGRIVLRWAATRPDNDDFINAHDLYYNTGTLTQDNLAATAESGEAAHDGNPPRKSLWFQWSSYSDNAVTFDTIGSTFDTVMAVYTASAEPATLGNLTTLVSDDDSGGGSRSRVSFQPEDGVVYYIAVDGFNGAAGTLQLNWGMAPDNDNFANARDLYYEEGTVSGTNVGATKEGGELNHGGNAGGKSVWYKWTAPGYGTIVVRTASSNQSSEFDTLLSVYSGSDLPSLLAIASNDNISATDLTSRVSFSAIPGRTYYIAVDGKNTGAGAAAGDLVLDWIYTSAAPPNDNFANAQLISGSAGTVNGSNFAATPQTGEPAHGGNAANHSIWYKWTAPAAKTVTFDTRGGDLDPTLVVYTSSAPTPALNNLTAVATTNYGSGGLSFVAVNAKTYYIVLDDYYQDSVTLNWATAPANDALASAQTLSGRSGTINGNNAGATEQTDEYANHSVWYKWTAPLSRRVTFDTIGSSFYTVLETYTATTTPPAMNSLDYIADNTGGAGDGASKVVFAATAGTTYYISVDGNAIGQAGNFVLNWVMAPDNDNFADAQLLSGNSGTVNGTNLSAGKESNEPDHAGNIGGKSVWYKWTPTVSGYSASLSLSSNHGLLGVYTANGAGLSNLVAMPRSDASDNDAQRISFILVEGTTYHIAVDGNNSGSYQENAPEGSFTLNWAFTSQAPPNDNFANAQVFSGNGGTVAGSNLRATKETGEPNHVGIAGDKSVWFKWSSPNAGQLSINTATSAFDTLLGVYTGNAVGALTQVTANDDSGGITSSVGPLSVAAGAIYYVAVAGKSGVQGHIAFSWSFVPAAPTINGFSPASGLVGTSVLITGANLSGASKVRFNGRDAAFTFASNGIRAVVPDSATSGKISVITPGGTATSTNDFTVTNQLPALRINDALKTEGNTGSSNAVFTVTLVNPNSLNPTTSAQNVTVRYSVAANTATAGSDYTAVSGTLTIAAGQTSAAINVPILGDVKDELDETFVLRLSNPVGATLLRNQAAGTIIDDDAAPRITIDNIAANEGNNGTSNITFALTLNTASDQTVRVAYNTADGTAKQSTDYTGAIGTVTFAPGETSKIIAVAVLGDTIVEPNENFAVILSNPANATIADAQGIGTITNDDGGSMPTITISNASKAEGNTGSSNAVFTVMLSAAATQAVTVQYATSNGTATAPADYTATTGTLTIAAGQTGGTINVPVVGDATVEPNETFNVTLSNPSNATIADGAGIGTITDDDSTATTPLVSINDVTVTEGNNGTTNATFTLTLSKVSAQTAEVNAIPTNGTAKSPGDYTSGGRRITFAPGVTTQTISVPVVGDLLDEASETFYVLLSAPANVTISRGRGVGTITDNDVAPSISITNLNIGEGNSGQRVAAVRLNLSAPSGQAVRVTAATAVGTATAGNDYNALAPTVISFNVGSTVAYARVLLNGDLLKEPDETFLVNLSSPVNATIADNQAIGTILNDDSAPALLINDVEITEGGTGTKNLNFTVTLSKASGQSITVNYATADGVARSTSDYTARNGTLTFTPGGALTQIISVSIRGDLVVEDDETFYVFLSGATNASIGKARGVGTITNDDSSG